MPRGVRLYFLHVTRAHTCPVHVLTIVCIELLVQVVPQAAAASCGSNGAGAEPQPSAAAECRSLRQP